MRYIVIFIIGFFMFGCEPQPPKEPIQELPSIDVQAEMQAIEDLRDMFEKNIKEQKYENLRPLATKDVKTIGPGMVEWAEMYRLRGERGLFPYDSIVMHPTETILLNDSMAYDWGSSTVYTSDEDGNVIVLRDSFLVILKKEDGQWKVHREVASGKVMDQDVKTEEVDNEG